MSNDNVVKFGPTKDFPRGKISADDEGGLNIGVGADKAKGVVVIQFGGPVAWLAMDAETASRIAGAILAKVKELEA